MSSTQHESTLPYMTDWNTIDWYEVEKSVNKLQKRIYHAQSIKDYRKVRNLQRMLVNGWSALLLAIRRVTQLNKGKHTSGIDGFRALNDNKRLELFNSMKYMNIKLHKPKPAYRKYIRKKNGKYRSLGIPVIKDRVYQEIIRIALEPQVEVDFEPISYGFRPKRGCHDAASRIMFNIRGGKWEWIFEGDFRSCFDTLDHEFILKQIKRFPLYTLIEKFLKAGYVDKEMFYDTKEGTPQGALLSPLLANIALNGMEKLLRITYTEIKDHNGNSTYATKGEYRMVRYADDFVIFAKSKEDIEKIYDILEPYLKDRGLSLAEDKTKITHISEGFNFLGFNFRRYNTKDGIIHLNKPSKESIKEFKSKVAEIARQCRGQNVDELIKRLNPLIRGTANYWKPTVAKKIFSSMDHYIWFIVFKFIRRLHSNKGLRWLKKTYFPPYHEKRRLNNWVLTSPKTGERLIQMSWTPIKRHIMIKYNYSPHDKSKIEYFKNRLIC